MSCCVEFEFAPCLSLYVVAWQTSDGVEVALRSGRQVAIDATFGLDKEGLDLTTVIATNGPYRGAVICHLLLGDKRGVTLWRALDWLTRSLSDRAVAFHPERCFMDDDRAEQNAVRLVWERCGIRICIWHVLQVSVSHEIVGLVACMLSLGPSVWGILQRNMTVKLSKKFSDSVTASKIEKLVWAAARTDCTGRVLDLPRAVYEALGSPGLSQADACYAPSAIATLIQGAQGRAAVIADR